MQTMKDVILNMRAGRTGGEQPLRTHNHATLSSHLKAASDRPELAAEPLRLPSCPHVLCSPGRSLKRLSAGVFSLVFQDSDAVTVGRRSQVNRVVSPPN